MHKVALVRSVTHAARLHDSASIHALTGRPLDGPGPRAVRPAAAGLPQLRQRRRLPAPRPRVDVPFASLPFPFRNVVDVPCQGGGFLGSAYDPLRDRGRSGRRGYQAEADPRRRGRRRRPARRPPVAARERSTAPGGDPALRGLYDRAYRLLDSEAIRRALDITREPPSVRERYGFGAEPVAVGEGGGGGNGAELGYARQMRGQNLLLARRLVEAGRAVRQRLRLQAAGPELGRPLQVLPTSTRRTCCRRPISRCRR